MDSTAASIGRLYEQYLDGVFSFVLYRVSDPSEAEDITLETFEAALSAFPRFRGESSPRAWLLGIARQKIAEAARRRDRRQRRELPEGQLSASQREMLALFLTADIRQLPEAAALQQEAQRVIHELLDRLPEAQREALLLQVEQELPIREIAKVIGRTEAATNSLLQRARAAIFRQGQHYFGT